ncbi:MAG: ATP-binding cassette domain-containing protein [Polyangiaceae bacterium]
MSISGSARSSRAYQEARLHRAPRRYFDKCTRRNSGELRCAHLSRGYQKRVSLADALIDEPPVLLLDEPTAGLDPTQNLETRRLIAELGKSRTIVVSTHVLAEVEAMCGSVLLIDEGRLIAHGTLDELLSQGRGTELRAIVRGPRATLDVALSSFEPSPELLELEEDLHQITLYVAPPVTFEAAAEDLTSILVRGGLHVRELKRRTTSLEQVFAALTQGAESP